MIDCKLHKNNINIWLYLGFPGGSDGNDSAGLIPESGRSPEKEMATQSNILAWRTPWTEGSGKVQSIGLQRVRHD